MNVRSTLALAAALTAGATLGLTATTAGAQMAPTPCADCDAKNAGPGNGSGFFFAFECDASTGESQHIVSARNRTNAPVNAHVNSDWRVIPAGGREVWTLPTPAYDPGLPYAMWIEWGMSTLDGRVIIPNRLQAFDCPCDQPTTTTSSPATTTIPPSSTPTMVPGTPSTAPAPVPGPGTTQPFRLPDTGTGSLLVALAALGFLAAGTTLLLVARKRDDER